MSDFGYLDDLSNLPGAEGSDTDGDGMIDTVAIDSDGDGVVDMIEHADPDGTFTTSFDGDGDGNADIVATGDNADGSYDGLSFTDAGDTPSGASGPLAFDAVSGRPPMFGTSLAADGVTEKGNPVEWSTSDNGYYDTKTGERVEPT